MSHVFNHLLDKGFIAENSSIAFRHYGKASYVDCVTFTSDTNDFTLTATNVEWDGTVEYSTDHISWMTWDGSAITSTSQKLYLRGYNNTTFWTSGGAQLQLSGPAGCHGNLNTLLQYDNPPTTLASYCYRYMFGNCTKLTTAPELPATTLASSCYGYMFYNCTNLTTAPSLPATTLADYCYEFMFSGCANLTTAPELPATTLASYCYRYMFYECTKLTTAPELPATTLATSCYDSMFWNCTKLTTVPDLPATTLASSCYKSMFRGCSKIKLSETYSSYSGYTTEYRIPKADTATTASWALNYMFSSTGGSFKSTPSINTTYYLHNSCSIV